MRQLMFIHIRLCYDCKGFGMYKQVTCAVQHQLWDSCQHLHATDQTTCPAIVSYSLSAGEPSSSPQLDSGRALSDGSPPTPDAGTPVKAEGSPSRWAGAPFDDAAEPPLPANGVGSRAVAPSDSDDNSAHGGSAAGAVPALPLSTHARALVDDDSDEDGEHYAVAPCADAPHQAVACFEG